MRLYGRINSVTGANSFRVNLDYQRIEDWSGLSTSGWKWLAFPSDFSISEGDHILQIIPGNGNAGLDKLFITNVLNTTPGGTGETAISICVPDTRSVVAGFQYKIQQCAKTRLETIYPNPFENIVHIPVLTAGNSYVSLIVFDIFGNEIAELAGNFYPAGKYVFEFHPEGLTEGFYYCTMRTEDCTETVKMILKKE